MNDITIIRKRYIPNEEVDISKDEIIYVDDEMLVTKWLPIRHKAEVKDGVSYLHINKGFKISARYDYNDELICYYCDILKTEVDKENKVYKEIDLLIDIFVYPNGNIKVVDLDELAEARKEELITDEQLLYALNCANDLLNIIYEGKFAELCQYNK